MSKTTLMAIGGIGLVGVGFFLLRYYQQNKQKNAATNPSTVATTQQAATPQVTGSTQRIYTVAPAMVYANTTIAK